MHNNDGTEAGFQQYLLNVVDHYQVYKLLVYVSGSNQIRVIIL